MWCYSFHRGREGTGANQATGLDLRYFSVIYVSRLRAGGGAGGQWVYQAVYTKGLMIPKISTLSHTHTHTHTHTLTTHSLITHTHTHTNHSLINHTHTHTLINHTHTLTTHS